MKNLLASLFGRAASTETVELLPEIAALPVASDKSTVELIAEIHHSFNAVGDKLLAEAQATLAGTDERSIAKGERLRAAGFVNTKQVKQTQEQAAKAAAARGVQELILTYALRYPTNKFITRQHVDQIAAKYSLVTGDISAYTGFVPEKNLRELEGFSSRFQKADGEVDLVRITRLSYEKMNSPAALAWAKLYPGLEVPLNSEHLRVPENGGVTPNLSRRGVGAERAYLFFEDYELVSRSRQLICAPAADMDLSQLKQQNGHWFRAQQIHVPDPVVLQPVKGGYLIVTAWGDEASDPLVLNEQLN
jgi:hypothetical protein